MENVINLNKYTNNNITYNLIDTLNNKKSIDNLSNETIKIYYNVFTNFLKCNNINYNDLINQIKSQQMDLFKKGFIIRYNPNDSILANYYTNFINYCRNRGNNENTILTKINTISSILKYEGIQTPTKIKINPKIKHKIGLSHKDITYILNNHCNIHQKALITFASSTGIRRTDLLNFKIIDFLKATYQYHYCTTLNEFIDNYKNNMIGYWEFIPNKTKKHDIICKVCNSGESSNYIIESLKQRIISIENYNKNNNDDLQLSERDYLFGNKNKHFKGQLNKETVTNEFTKKGKKFKEYKERELNQMLNNKEITINEYDNIMNNKPIFKLHNLRNFFISTIRQNISNYNICLFMEAHASDIKTDKYYINESIDNFNENTIREAYKEVEPYLTFNKYVNANDEKDLLLENKRLKEENKRLIYLENKIEAMATELLNKPSVLDKFND